MAISLGIERPRSCNLILLARPSDRIVRSESVSSKYSSAARASYLYSQSTNLGRYHYVPRLWNPRPGRSAAVEDANCHPSLQFQSYDSRNDKERTKIRVWSDLARDVASK